jgi:hypothetical protein
MCLFYVLRGLSAPHTGLGSTHHHVKEHTEGADIAVLKVEGLEMHTLPQSGQ